MTAFEVMDIVRAARERDASGSPDATCHLEVGQPGHPPPVQVIEAARAALDAPIGYTEGLGTPQLRERIAGHYSDRYGLALDPGRVAVTTGASGGCVVAFLACFDPGARVAVVRPGYPCYANILEAFGIEVVPLEVDRSSGYQPTPSHLDGAGPLDGLVVASPSNPTGAVLGADELGALATWCDGNDTMLMVDEIYHGISDRQLPTAAATGSAMVVQSFSKYFCMTGWRLGWLVLPEELVRPVERLSQNLYLSPPSLSQSAALAAFDATDELDAHARRYAENRELLVDALRGAGVEEVAPAEGAFYVWADTSRWGGSRRLCRLWLSELGVAATPGVDFDPRRGEGFVRFSVAGPSEEVAEGARRLAGWLSSTDGSGR